MMALFKLYYGGVLLGRADMGAASPALEVLDPFTGAWSGDCGLLTKLQINLEPVLTHFGEYAALFASAESGKVEASWGANYCKEGNGLYARKVKRGIDVLFESGQPYAFLIPSLMNNAIFVKEGMEDKTALAQWTKYDISPARHLVEDAGTFMVPMDDGVKLATHVWLPKGAARPLPTVFVRTPYHARNAFLPHITFVMRGYAVVTQDIRGREKSEGDFVSLAGEMKDGSASLDWIAAQDWSNGDVGTIGGSYCGFVQWEMAATGNPHLKCMVSMVTAGAPFVDIPRPGGALASGMLPWLSMMSTRSLEDVDKLGSMQRDNWSELMKIRPLSDIPQKVFGRPNASWEAWMGHETDDDFWLESNWSAHGKIEVPVMIESGWFDDDHKGSMEGWDIARSFPKEKRFLMLGPWLHGGNSTRDVHAATLGNGAIRYDNDLYWNRWFETHLRDRDMGFDKEGGVFYYMLGAEEWRHAEAFPPEDFAKTQLYFGPGGSLDYAPPAAEGSVSYTYDPENPAPHMIDPSENELAVAGDYTAVEQRDDVICFTLPVTQELEAAGDVVAEFWAASTAPDTDWVVRVTEVDDKGRSIQRCYGVLRAKFRNGFDKIDLLTPGKPERFIVRLGQFANRFKAGHSLRVHITSSAESFIIPNSNTGAPMASDEGSQTARQTILFGGEHPSKVTLYMKK